MGLERGSWNWVTCLSRLRCAQPSLLPLSKRSQRSRRLCRAMASLRSPCPGKRVVSRGRTSPFSPTGRCPVRLARRCAQPSSAAKPMAVCACSSAPGYSIVAAALCASSVSGTGKQPRSRVGSVYCCILSGLVPHRCGFARLEPERAPARLYAARATPTHRGEPAASRRSFATQSGSDPVPRAACPFSPLVGRAVRSQRASPHSESGDDQTVRRPRRLCHLARFGDGLIPTCVHWYKSHMGSLASYLIGELSLRAQVGINTVLTAVGFLLLGQACFSEWSLMASFPDCSSILPIFCLFCSPSRWFCHLSRAQRPVLNDFRSSDQD